MKKKVIIIGAGPAGLTAGYELLRQAPEAFDVTIYEETSAIGGISRTVQHNGSRMDIGGHRFFSKDKRVMDWWQAMMPRQGKPSFDDIKLGREKQLAPGGPDPEETDRVMLVRNRVSRIYYKHKFFDYPVSMKWETIKNMGFATTMEAGFSYLGSNVKKLEETSLENFYINRFGRKLYSMFFEGYTEKLWGRHGHQDDRQDRRQGRDLADRGVLLSEVRSRPALGDHREGVRGARRHHRHGGQGRSHQHQW